MKLINTDGMAFVGPGSEWLWTAISGIVLAVTFLAIYRQLRLQRSQAAMDQLDRFHREWTSERMLRHLHDAWVALRETKDPTTLPAGARYALANYWEKVGALAYGGHANPKLLWDLFGTEIGECWALLAPAIKAARTRLNDPTGMMIFNNFEWLVDAVARFSPSGVAVVGEANLLSVADVRIATLEGLLRVEEALRRVSFVSAETGGGQPAPAAPPA